MTPIFTQNNNLSENSCHFCEFAQFSKQSFARLKSKHLAQFFWWKVNLRELRGFILQKVQASVVERQKKKFCYRSLSFNIRCIFHFRKSTLCYISPNRDLQMPLAFNVYILIYFLLIWKVLQDINLDLLVKCYRV